VLSNALLHTLFLFFIFIFLLLFIIIMHIEFMEYLITTYGIILPAVLVWH